MARQIDIRTIDGRIHIDGYPEAAALVKFPPPLGKRLADLRLHEHDLAIAEQAMQHYGALRDVSPEAAEAIWTAALVKFYSCFGRNSVSRPLSKDMYKGQPNALEAFEHLKEIRNRCVVHNENALTYTTTGIVLDVTGGVVDVLSLGARAVIQHEATSQNLYELIAHAQKAVAAQIADALRAAFAFARSLTPEQRLALEPVKFGTAHLGVVTRTY